MSSTEAASRFFVFLLSVPVIQGQYGWGVTYSPTKICALKGSTVEIHCSYRYPSRINSDITVMKTIWFTKVSYYEPVDLTTDPQYSGRVQDHCDKIRNYCTLRITDLRESDSAVYMFMFITNKQGWGLAGSPGVTLSVTDPDLQVQVKSIVHQGYSKAELRCHSSCRLPDSPSYIWYENGQKIKEDASSISVSITLTDSYSCALKGHEDLPSPSVCVDGRYCNRVTYTHRSVCAIKGSSVDISCTYNSHSDDVESKLWFTTERSHQWQNPSQPEDLRKDSQYAGRVQVLETNRGRSTLRVTNLRESDSAQYHFKFTTPSFEWGSSLPGTTLTVTDPDLQVQVRRYSSFSSWRELNCHSRCRLPDRPSFIWYKNGQEVCKETSSSYSDYFGSVDSYSCAVKGHEDFPSPPVCVYDQTCNRVTYTSRSICALKGSLVDISCTYKSYEDDVESKLWFSHSQPGDITEDYQFAGRVQVLETKGGHSTLRITDLRESDSGQYHFKFKTPSFEWESSLAGTALTVTALQVQVTRITVYQSYTEAELKCHSSCSPAGRLSYVWFKNGEKIIEDSSSYKDQFYPGDFISCAFEEHKDYSSPSVYAPEVPSVSVNPSAEIMEGTLVTLTCGGDANTAAKYTWYKENQTLITEEPQLVFSSIQSSDSGLYYCIAENQLGRRTSDYMFIIVKYAPKTSSVSVSPSAEIVEGSSVTLTCSSDANPAAKYTWYKENQTLLQGPEGNYRFTSISSEDRVYYHCKSKNQYGQMNSSSLFIDVQYAPKLPSVSVSPSAEIVEGSSVTLTCSSDANPAANYTWYKEDEDSPKASGQIFTISNITAEHSGNYYCEAQNTRGRHNSTLHLTVVAGAWKSTAVGTATTVVLAVILLSVFILTRKKRAAKQSFRSGERSDYRTQYLPPGRQLDDPQDDLHYASVRFCKNQADLAVRPVQPHRHETEESVVYADVTFKRCQKSTGEDPAALYSTINKTR
ncbi:sialoadhesin-like [Epinephelus lanceolatus]